MGPPGKRDLRIPPMLLEGGIKTYTIYPPNTLPVLKQHLHVVHEDVDIFLK